MNLQETVVEPQSAGTRLELFFTRCLPDIMKGEGFSRSGMQKLIAEGQMTLNVKPAKATARFKTNDLVTVKVSPPKRTTLAAAPIARTAISEPDAGMAI